MPKDSSKCVKRIVGLPTARWADDIVCGKMGPRSVHRMDLDPSSWTVAGTVEKLESHTAVSSGRCGNRAVRLGIKLLWFLSWRE